MAHNAKRSQKRRIARIKADATGRQWQTNAQKRQPAPAAASVVPREPAHQEPGETLNERLARLADTSETRRSARRAAVAGRMALRRATTTTHLRDVDLRYLQLTGE